MRSDQLARALIRLYPRAWRERYGEELLALIDDAGLTWRIVADVVAGATVERVRALIALRNRPRDPIAEARAQPSMTFRQLVTEIMGVAVPVVLTIGALAAVGVPWPSPTTWLVYASSLMNGHVLLGPPMSFPRASGAERIGLRYYFFLEATGLAGGLWLLARALTAAGVPEPSGIWVIALFSFVVAGAVRLIYCGMRIATTPGRWMGLHDAEIRAWQGGVIVALVSGQLAVPSGEAFWSFALICFWLLRTPTDSLTRLGAARRRAAYELNLQRLREKFPVQVFPLDWK